MVGCDVDVNVDAVPRRSGIMIERAPKGGQLSPYCDCEDTRGIITFSLSYPHPRPSSRPLSRWHAELQMHVLDPVHQPNGRSRVDQLARCILAAPIPDLPVQPVPTLSMDVSAEAEQGMGALCMRCV